MRGQREGEFFVGGQTGYAIAFRIDCVNPDIRKIQEVMMRVGGKALRRSRSNRVLAGVCGGLEEFFGLDAFWFRLAFLVALLPGGVPGIVLYLIMWVIVPAE